MVVDVGVDSHPCVAAWRMGVESALARKIISLSEHQETALLTFGSDHTNNALSHLEHYQGINEIWVRSMCISHRQTPCGT